MRVPGKAQIPLTLCHIMIGRVGPEVPSSNLGSPAKKSSRMPWHRVRTDYDHHRDHRRRLTYRLDVSILVATAILASVVLFGFLPFFEREPEQSWLVQLAPLHETPTHLSLI